MPPFTSVYKLLFCKLIYAVLLVIFAHWLSCYYFSLECTTSLAEPKVRREPASFPYTAWRWHHAQVCAVPLLDTGRAGPMVESRGRPIHCFFGNRNQRKFPCHVLRRWKRQVLRLLWVVCNGCLFLFATTKCCNVQQVNIVIYYCANLIERKFGSGFKG